MFSNKHVVVSLLIAPVLAVLAWFAVGHWFGEPPRPAEPGASYPLLEKSNCRYDSGECTLANGAMQFTITARSSASGTRYTLTSAIALQGAAVGSRGEAGVSSPAVMLPEGDSGLVWVVDRPSINAGREKLLVVVEAAGSRWYGEAQTAFMTSTAVRGSDSHEAVHIHNDML